MEHKNEDKPVRVDIGGGLYEWKLASEVADGDVVVETDRQPEPDNNPYTATLVVNDNVHAAMKRAARNPKTAGITVGFWLERHNDGDTGNGMWWDTARVQTRNRLEGLPFFSQWQLNRNNLVRIRTANGVTTVSLVSGARI